MEVLLAVVFLIAIFAYGHHVTTKRRREYLLNKYRNMALVEAIMARRIWQGMTKEQLIDSRGEPVDRGQKVTKTKTSETFKYNKIGRNRFQSRVMLENGVVVGWQER